MRTDLGSLSASVRVALRRSRSDAVWFSSVARSLALSSSRLLLATGSVPLVPSTARSWRRSPRSVRPLRRSRWSVPGPTSRCRGGPRTRRRVRSRFRRAGRRWRRRAGRRAPTRRVGDAARFSSSSVHDTSWADAVGTKRTSPTAAASRRESERSRVGRGVVGHRNESSESCDRVVRWGLTSLSPARRWSLRATGRSRGPSGSFESLLLAEVGDDVAGLGLCPAEFVGHLLLL